MQVKRLPKRKPRSEFQDSPENAYEKRIILIRRVTRVNKGGKRLRISVCLVIGDKKGKVGIGLGKGTDVKSAEEKAFNYARKHMMQIPLKNNTIPHEMFIKSGASKIYMKPAAPGTGVVAGSSLRSVLEVVGVKDILTKIIGTNNKITNAYTTLEALASMKVSRVS